MREDTSLSTMRGAAAGRRGQRAASGAPCVRSVSAACPLCVRCVSTCARAPAVRPLYVRCASAVCPLCVGPLYVRPLHAAMTQLADDARRSGNPNRRGAIRTGAVPVSRGRRRNCGEELQEEEELQEGELHGRMTGTPKKGLGFRV